MNDPIDLPNDEMMVVVVGGGGGGGEREVGEGEERERVKLYLLT